MALFRWDDSYSVKIKQFDAQHQKLFTMINDLDDAINAGRSNDVLGKVFDDLVDYVLTHFSAEEQMMKANNYPQFYHHRTEHANLTARAFALQTDFRSGKTGVTLETLDFLKSWLADHILVTDKAYGPFFNAAGIS